MSNIVKQKINSIDFAGKKPADIVNLIGQKYQENNLSAELELTFVQFIIQDNSALRKAAEVNPKSLYSSLLQAAKAGLSFNPTEGEAYLVAYNIKTKDEIIPTIQLGVMYKGKAKQLIHKGFCKDIQAKLVYKGDEVKTEVINGEETFEHKYDMFSSDRANNDNIIGGYAIVTMNNGEKRIIPAPRDYIDRCFEASKRKMNGTVSPAWKNWFDRMAMKCVINNAYNQIPKAGVKPESIAAIEETNTQDVDFVDVSNEKALNEPIKDEPKRINDKQYSKLKERITNFDTSVDIALQELKGHNLKLSDEQEKEIKEIGTITDEMLPAIADEIKEGRKELGKFEFILTSEQFDTLSGLVL